MSKPYIYIYMVSDLIRTKAWLIGLSLWIFRFLLPAIFKSPLTAGATTSVLATSTQSLKMESFHEGLESSHSPHIPLSLLFVALVMTVIPSPCADIPPEASSPTYEVMSHFIGRKLEQLLILWKLTLDNQWINQQMCFHFENWAHLLTLWIWTWLGLSPIAFTDTVDEGDEILPQSPHLESQDDQHRCRVWDFTAMQCKSRGGNSTPATHSGVALHDVGCGWLVGWLNNHLSVDPLCIYINVRISGSGLWIKWYTVDGNVEHSGTTDSSVGRAWTYRLSFIDVPQNHNHIFAAAKLLQGKMDKRKYFTWHKSTKQMSKVWNELWSRQNASSSSVININEPFLFLLHRDDLSHKNTNPKPDV